MRIIYIYLFKLILLTSYPIFNLSYLYLSPPWRRHGLSFQQICKPFPLECFVPRLVEMPHGFGEEDENLEILRRRQRDDRQRTNCNQRILLKPLAELNCLI